MAKKRQLNVRLSDALVSQLDDRAQKTKMGMAAMVEILLIQALQHQEAADESKSPLSDRLDSRLDSLEKRIEALEATLAISSTESPEIEVTAAVVETNSEQSILDEPVVLNDENQVGNINSQTLESTSSKPKKEKLNSKTSNSKPPNSKAPNSKVPNSKVLN
jgi:hypothetical protein